MLQLPKHPALEAYTVKPVDKITDRAIIREIFRREFYGDSPLHFPDDGLWEIYDRMDTSQESGAFLVFHDEQVLFLLEIHPAIQMDIPTEYITAPGAIGIYCFGPGREESACLPAFKACMAALLSKPGIGRVLTSLNPFTSADPRTSLLEKTGFRKLHGPATRTAIYCCTRDNLHPPEKHRPTGILFALPSALTE